MRIIQIWLFGAEDCDPAYETYPDEEHVAIQVQDRCEDRVPEYYDFRLRAPVAEHVLGEVTQLVDDLVHNHVARIGGLQPSLF